MKKTIVKNWKTTIAGVIVAVAFYLKYENLINENFFNLIFGLGSAFGLILAKDATN